MTTQEMVRADCESLREVLLRHSSIDAAALYGSVARGDVEKHSDVDLLVVCRSSRKLGAYSDVQELLQGCLRRLSLTVYSERELKFLRTARSLFLLHLSREAILLFDKNNFLRSLLADFSPKPSYRDDFQKSLQLLDPLRTIVQEAPNNLHRLSYIYSLFRVFGVYLLAEKGIYEFSKSRMSQLLLDGFPSRAKGVELLKQLRELNSNFFTGGVTAAHMNYDISTVLQRTEALTSLAGVSMSVDAVPYAEAVRFFEEAVGSRGRGLDYRLRMWFLMLVYDGLNLYRTKTRRAPLTSFAEAALQGIVQGDNPEGVRHAARDAVLYLHRYPLKYFLSEDSKIDPRTSRNILRQLADELDS